MIYLIGSLRNSNIPRIANKMRNAGLDVFDSWYAPGHRADDYWREYTKIRGLSYKEALNDYSARHVFEFDKKYLDKSSAAVMVMPAGKSGHLELGYIIGTGKRGYILFDKEPKRYDVMVNFATDIFFNLGGLIETLKKH